MEDVSTVEVFSGCDEEMVIDGDAKHHGASSPPTAIPA